MTRRIHIRLAIAALALPIVAGAAIAVNSDVQLSGESYAAYAQTSTAFLPRTAYAVLPAAGGIHGDAAAAASLSGVISAEALEGHTTGVGDSSDASVQSFSTLSSVNLLNGLIKADAVVAMTVSKIRDGVAQSNAEGSQFGYIEVAGVELDPDVAPNTTIALPGVGSVVLNEQIPGGDGVSSSTLTLNMIHVRLTNVFGQQTGEIIVGSAKSAVSL